MFYINSHSSSSINSINWLIIDYTALITIFFDRYKTMHTPHIPHKHFHNFSQFKTLTYTSINIIKRSIYFNFRNSRLKSNQIWFNKTQMNMNHTNTYDIVVIHVFSYFHIFEIHRICCYFTCFVWAGCIQWYTMHIMFSMFRILFASYLYVFFLSIFYMRIQICYLYLIKWN